MLHFRLRAGSLAALLLMVCIPQLKAGENSWVNKTILIKSPGVKFGQTDDNGRQVYHGTLVYSDYVVVAERDGWLKVRQRGIDGWFDKREGILVDDAPRYFSKAIEKDAQDEWALGNRARAWELKGEFDRALKDRDLVVRLLPDDANSWNNRGVTCLLKKDFAGALEDLDEAIRLDPSVDTFYLHRATAWVGKGELKKAISDCTEAIRLAPRDEVGYLARGNVWSQFPMQRV